MSRKYTKEMKIRACEDFLNRRKSRKQIALELNMGKRGAEKIREWAKMYELNGSLAFSDSDTHKSYTKELKMSAINDYLSTGMSMLDVSAKYNLSSCTLLREWLSKYNNGEKFKTITNDQEVYSMPRTKTTEDERIKIVRYCIENDCNYGKTASLYGVSYHQVYEWCKKFRNSGEEGLKDNRGKTAVDGNNEKDNKYIIQINKLKHRNEQLEREIEVLKKACALKTDLLHLQGIRKKN